MTHRSTLQTTTGTTPCFMFGREVRSKLPELKRETVGVPGKEVRERDWSSKLKGKAYADLKRGAMPKSLRVGNTVLLKAEKTNKLSTNFNPDPFKVVHKTGSEVSGTGRFCGTGGLARGKKNPGDDAKRSSRNV